MFVLSKPDSDVSSLTNLSPLVLYLSTSSALWFVDQTRGWSAAVFPQSHVPKGHAQAIQRKQRDETRKPWIGKGAPTSSSHASQSRSHNDSCIEFESKTDYLR